MPLLPSPTPPPPASPPSSCCRQSAGEVLLPVPAAPPLPLPPAPAPGRPRLLLLLLGLVNMPLDPSPSPSPSPSLPSWSLPYCGCCRTDDEDDEGAADAGEVLSGDPRVADAEDGGAEEEAGAGGEKDGWEAVRYLGAMAAAASISDSAVCGGGRGMARGRVWCMGAGGEDTVCGLWHVHGERGFRTGCVLAM